MQLLIHYVLDDSSGHASKETKDQIEKDVEIESTERPNAR